MNATPLGWSPHPKGQPRRGLPNWVWATVAIGLSVTVAIVVGVVVFNSGPPMPDEQAPTSPSASPARSSLIPDLQLPEGTTKRGYKSQEVFDVTQPFADTVDALRSQLPIGRVYDGLAWCAEADSGDESTTWSWGDESDYLSVWVSSSPQNPGSTVQIEREPHPAGCVP